MPTHRESTAMPTELEMYRSPFHRQQVIDFITPSHEESTARPPPTPRLTATRSPVDEASIPLLALPPPYLDDADIPPLALPPPYLDVSSAATAESSTGNTSRATELPSIPANVVVRHRRFSFELGGENDSDNDTDTLIDPDEIAIVATRMSVRRAQASRRAAAQHRPFRADEATLVDRAELARERNRSEARRRARQRHYVLHEDLERHFQQPYGIRHFVQDMERARQPDRCPRVVKSRNWLKCFCTCFCTAMILGIVVGVYILAKYRADDSNWP